MGPAGVWTHSSFGTMKRDQIYGHGTCNAMLRKNAPWPSHRRPGLRIELLHWLTSCDTATACCQAPRWKRCWSKWSVLNLKVIASNYTPNVFGDATKAKLKTCISPEPWSAKFESIHGTRGSHSSALPFCLPCRNSISKGRIESIRPTFGVSTHVGRAGEKVNLGHQPGRRVAVSTCLWTLSLILMAPLR